MRTPEILAQIDIPRQKLYYLEQKGYIHPHKTTIGDKEFREYSEEDARKVSLIWKYLKSGFKYKVAFEKAMEELNDPQMQLIKNHGADKADKG
jgi:DNA-binding transcriptional MerR regulator